MKIYLGYGLLDIDIDNNDIVELYKKYHEESYREIAEGVENAGSETPEEDIKNEVIDGIYSDYSNVVEFVCGIVNREEGADILSYFVNGEGYSALYYAPVEFPKDASERAERVRSREEFLVLLKSYLPVSADYAGRIVLSYNDEYDSAERE